jgi:hypothetical protein
MANFEQKPETGSLFDNNRKSSQTHADMNGECLIDGKVYYMNAWRNKTKSGSEYLSVKFKLKEDRSVKSQKDPDPF